MQAHHLGVLGISVQTLVDLTYRVTFQVEKLLFHQFQMFLGILIKSVLVFPLTPRDALLETGSIYGCLSCLSCSSRLGIAHLLHSNFKYLYNNLFTKCLRNDVYYRIKNNWL